MAEDLDKTISENGKGPARVRGDSSEMQQHRLKDQIEVDRYLNSKEAAKSNGLDIRMSKLVPPGPD